jgi:putative PIN family toxin of toxin-antitoxin system
VYVSALHTGGIADEVLAEARAGRFRLFVSHPILQELERVLVRKLKWAPERAKEAIAAVRRLVILITPSESVVAIPDDDPDNRILECAPAADARLIVTGDRLLRALGSYRGIAIVSPRQFLDLDPSTPESPQSWVDARLCARRPAPDVTIAFMNNPR